MFATIFNPLAICISLTTATGIFIHDMHIDSAASTALSVPMAITHYEVNKLAGFGDSHTHVERGAAAHAIIDLQGQNPRIHPRTVEDKKYLLQKRVVRGHYAFDNYNLPIVN